MCRSSTPPFPPFCFFFNDTATTEIYTLSLHDALPISARRSWRAGSSHPRRAALPRRCLLDRKHRQPRSEEHTSELQSQSNLVCRLLLEKKKKKLYHLLVSKKKKKQYHTKQ